MSMSLGWPAWAVELVVDRESTRLGMGKEGRKHAEAGASVADAQGQMWPGTVSQEPPAFGMTVNTSPEGRCGQRYEIQVRALGTIRLRQGQTTEEELCLKEV